MKNILTCCFETVTKKDQNKQSLITKWLNTQSKLQKEENQNL